MAAKRRSLRFITVKAIEALTQALTAPVLIGGMVAISNIVERDGVKATKVSPSRLNEYFEKVADIMADDKGEVPADLAITLALVVVADTSNPSLDVVIPAGRYPGLDLTFWDPIHSMSLVGTELAGPVSIRFQNVGSLTVSQSVFDGPFVIQGYIPALTLCDATFKTNIDVINSAPHSINFSGENRFVGPVAFAWATLCGDIGKSIFGGRLDFTHATFTKDVCGDLRGLKAVAHSTTFADAVFNSLASFNTCHFVGDVSFKGAVFHGGVDFDDSRFDGDVDLKATFGPHLSLKGCRFSSPPEINESGFQIDTTISFRQSSYAGSASDEDMQRYRRLRKIAAAQHDHFYQNEFFALEQRTLTCLEFARNPFSLSAWVSLLYRAFSFYGQRFVRTIVWWVGLNIAFWLSFWDASKEGFLSYRGREMPPWIEVDAYLAVVNALLPFTAIRDTSLQMTPALLVASIVQSTLSLVLIALTLLAVRRRFSKGADS